MTNQSQSMFPAVITAMRIEAATVLYRPGCTGRMGRSGTADSWNGAERQAVKRR